MAQVVFGSDISDLQAGIDKAKAAIASMSEPVDQAKTSIDGLTQSMKLIGTGLAVGAAVGGAVAYFKELGEEMIHLEQNSKEVGLSLREFQNLKFVAGLGGVGDEKFVESLRQAAEKLNELSHGTSDLSKFLDANNQKYEDANGKLISMDQYIAIAARLIQNAATEGDKFKAAALLGFSREWVEILEKGPTSLRASTEEAARLGIALDDNVVHKAADFEREWNELTAEWASMLKHWVIDDIAPAIRTMISTARTDWANFTRDVSALWGRITSGALQEASPALKTMIDTARTEWDKFANGDFKVPDQLKAIGTVLQGGALQAQKDTASAQLPGYWMTVTDEITKAGEMIKEIGQQSFLPEGGTTKFPEKENLDAMRAGMEEMRGVIQQANIAFEQVEELSTASAKLFETTEAQKTAALLAALDVRTNAQLLAAAQELDNLNESDADYLAAHQRTVNASIAIEMEAAAKRKKILDDQRAAEVNEWKAMAAPIQGAFDLQLRGLLVGTVTWGQAMKSIAADVVLSMIKKFEELAVVNNITKGLQSAFGAAPDSSGILKAISASVAQVYAGSAAYFAPAIGPLAVPAAAAVAATVGVGAAAFMGHAEAGAWEIPRTSAWMLHPGETVLPAGAASAFREAAEGSGPFGGGGGGGGGETHIHIHTIDAAGVQQFVKRYAPQIANATRAHMDNNPTTFGR